MIILVCGGRNYTDYGRLDSVLTEFDAKEVIFVTGGARGADALCAEWCADHGIPFAVVPALWELYGKYAGPVRNAWMLRLKPDKVVAFPGGKGTANMIRLAKKAGVEVIEVE